MVRISILAFSGAFWADCNAFHSGVSYLFIVCIPVLCVYCVVVEYNADSVPTFQSPMITGSVADVLCMYTVLRVLPCYRIVLPCYRCSVTGNSLTIVCIGYAVLGYWLLRLPSFSLHGSARVYYRACACMCARLFACACVCVRITNDP